MPIDKKPVNGQGNGSQPPQKSNTGNPQQSGKPKPPVVSGKPNSNPNPNDKGAGKSNGKSTGESDKKVPPQKQEPTKPKKDETLKYELTHANGGFNDGVEIKPAKNGKLQLTISLYGGGDVKSMGISPLPPNIAKLVKAYEVGATNDDSSTPEITDELKKKFEDLKVKLSLDIIQILQDTDAKIGQAIKNIFK